METCEECNRQICRTCRRHYCGDPCPCDRSHTCACECNDYDD